ncbi:MAG: secretion system X translation initiation factor [Nitrosospira sp.]|nr:secretion system X translation initiation factor [Nitrosospira sp.]
MKGSEQRRRLWLGGALLATLLATRWVSGEDGNVDTVSAAPQQSGPKTEVRVVEDETGQLELERLQRRKFAAQAGDIFSRKTWIPPPPPPSSAAAAAAAAAMKPQPPSPPPLSFKYLGKLTNGDETQVFLALADRNYVVKPGEVINDQYRVDAVNDHTIIFTYLPLNAKQTLSTGAAGV